MSKGAQLRKLIEKENLLILPGAFNPLVGIVAKDIGFQALYLSGGALSASLGKQDIGIIVLEELAQMAKQIVSATGLPLLVDADTGFGEAADLRKTVTTLESAGVAGLHIEDQVDAKKCGHLEGKQLISQKEMCEKIKAAVDAKKDKNFFVMARTDARSVEGIEAAIARAKAYVAAGADGIFPEGLTSKEEFAQFAKAFPKTPLLANMTEFGKTPLITAKEFGELGYAMVIFPVTSLRLAMKAIEEGLREIKTKGTQEKLLKKMQTRQELYKLLHYEGRVK